MKRPQSPYFIIFILACIFTSACDSGAVKGQEPATFSCDLDASSISGSGVDEMQQRNTAFIYPMPVTGDHVMFTLYSTKDGNDPKPDYSIRIYVPRKTGTYTITDADDDADNHNYVTIDFLSGDFSRYRQGNFTVTITSISSTRVSGTFSGKGVLSNDTPRGTKKEITLSNGKFDVPFSTGNIRPL